jgi:hypothetical protein
MAEPVLQSQMIPPADPTPIDIVLFCPNCGAQHIDEPQPERGWQNPPHRSHECQFCKDLQGNAFVWRPADVPTNGVREILTKGTRDQVIQQIDLTTVDPRERWQIPHIKRIVQEEFARCMEFGMSPGVEDYRYALLNWMENGVTPSEFQRQIGGAHL